MKGRHFLVFAETIDFSCQCVQEIGDDACNVYLNPLSIIIILRVRYQRRKDNPSIITVGRRPISKEASYAQFRAFAPFLLPLRCEIVWRIYRLSFRLVRLTELFRIIPFFSFFLFPLIYVDTLLINLKLIPQSKWMRILLSPLSICSRKRNSYSISQLMRVQLEIILSSKLL